MTTTNAHLSDDTLLDLVHALLPENARAEALSHLASCESCAARFRVRAAAHERGRAAYAANAAAPAVPLTLAPAQAPKRSSHASRWLALAASIAIVAGAAVFWPRPEQLPDASHAALSWLPVPATTPERRAGLANAADSALHAGIAAYERRDLDTAVALLRASQADGANEVVRRAYLGSALVALARDAEAVPVLSTPEFELAPEPWRGESQWALAIALSRTGQRARADSVLRDLATRETPAAARARALLRATR